MTLATLFWYQTTGQDIHLLPGLASPELTRVLRAGDLDQATNEVIEKQLHQMPGLTVAFIAQLAGTLASHGLAMDDKTGEISVDPGVPLATKGHSFLVTATAKQGTVTASTRIRVCVHGAILRMWLTPARLTVRKGAKNMRLSVLAMFDDGVIGDITNWSPFDTPGGPSDHTYVHPVGSNDTVLTWSPQAGAVRAHRETGVLDATSDSGSAPITVQGLGRSETATVVCAPPWSSAATLELVAGPGPKDMNFVPNLLFLPEGFQKSEKEEFKRQVRRVVARWSLRNRTRPFASFSGRFNYFMAWVPSPDSGVTVLEELDRARKDPPPDTGETVTPASLGRPPHTGTAKWSVSGMINEVGLPTAVGDPDGSPLSTARIQAWQNLYGTFVTEDRVKDVYPKWLALNDRVLLNELDTAFHRAFGERPTADQKTLMQAPVFNPRRLHVDDFKAFLDALTGPGGQPVWTTGKDNDLVVVVCRSSHVGGVTSAHEYGGSEDGHTVAVSLGLSDAT